MPRLAPPLQSLQARELTASLTQRLPPTRPNNPRANSPPKTATFAKVSKTNEAFTAALDAHDLAAGLKQTDKSGAIKGTVAKVFEPRGGSVAQSSISTPITKPQ